MSTCTTLVKALRTAEGIAIDTTIQNYVDSKLTKRKYRFINAADKAKAILSKRENALTLLQDDKPERINHVRDAFDRWIHLHNPQLTPCPERYVPQAAPAPRTADDPRPQAMPSSVLHSIAPTA